MEQTLENILIYSAVGLLCFVVIFLYLRRQRHRSKVTEEKIRLAKQEGLYEPISLHPVVDGNKCIGTGACITACPEKDILGIINGKATTINASRCIGHGACFHACPTHAISLFIGTDQRGVDLPHINARFETNIPGIFIAGELGGMGLIKNAVEQGRQAVENIVKSSKKHHHSEYDLVIIGAGPAGISASLTAKKHHLKALTLEQDTLGGTVFSFPRAKIVMTGPMDLPLYGKLKLYQTSKPELLELWKEVIKKHGIEILENAKVEAVVPAEGYFRIETLDGKQFTTAHVLLTIGRRGSPRKLGVPGESLEKVAYRLLEPEAFSGQNVLVVGGGDSAIESALQLADANTVILSYRGDSFGRIKPMNQERIRKAAADGKVDLRFLTNVRSIEEKSITLVSDSGEPLVFPNDLVFIFAGGELPTQFLKKIGIEITTKFGEAILKHD